ncbi:MAG TPA: mechanosensitive ion channel family protein [Polyangiaceae bacterium LLY-WYZ-15_(1-7)]|nr:mechanosensitive ion channel protein [Myxococcales bacterium]MAT28877.1 mechanosensitive ion channel protein [Sandaracinus sp.]HJK94924.1 mechanosensitive ion channel family protein [Polyangiaceae bacterium LLY-WYZ-15_(1-7)]HJL01731.1 mechanosensitive ion channel family protein [Polyangiaceae bacterium LLY-WYZ-15_(1-7)]HJL07993.1 mechanosensitive ion channel family protein [Polyangiaceae bacterium LLY-WYZ-15_(1-7)]
MIDELWNAAQSWIASGGWKSFLRAGALLVFGALVAKLVSATLARTLSARLDAQRAMLLRRGTFYPILLLSLFAALRELGLDLSVFLGAAGIVTVAIGFASQTSASNLISGLFLIGEGAFSVGDTIQVGEVFGEVLSIDLMSVKVRTFDNLYVRIPNETMVKANVTNLSRFALRRADLVIRVGYGTNLDRLRALLEEVADAEPRALTEPKPLIFVQEFEPTGVRVQFSVWMRREVFIEVRARLQAAVRTKLDEAGIAAPFARWAAESPA